MELQNPLAPFLYLNVDAASLFIYSDSLLCKTTAQITTCSKRRSSCLSVPLCIVTLLVIIVLHYTLNCRAYALNIRTASIYLLNDDHSNTCTIYF